MDLKEKLAELRREKGWSQDELALKLNVTRQAVSKWERGAALPSTENLVYIGKLYGIPLDELVNGEQQCEEPLATAVAVVEEPATAVTVVEKPEAGEKRGKPDPLRLVGAAVLAGCLLLTGVAAGIVIGSTVLREPEKTKDGLTIISQDDLQQEYIDTEKLMTFDGKVQDIKQ